jgi:cyclopropane-fatty-acyl-phospholipid synthase
MFYEGIWRSAGFMYILLRMAKDLSVFVADLLRKADVTVGGDRPWDLQVHNPKLYSRVMRQGNLGLGESYMDGWWDAEELDEFVTRVLRARLDKNFQFTLSDLWMMAKSYLFNLQNTSRATQVAEEHYDLGNDLYQKMLDPRMVYTSGYWGGIVPATDLAEAQRAKLDLICRKIGLKAGDRVLDIGCGFGGFAKYAAEKYGASVVGISISKEQIAYAKEV